MGPLGRGHEDLRRYNQEEIALCRIHTLRPFRPIDFANRSEGAKHDEIVKVVELILAAKARDYAADTIALEKQIDDLIYKLYGLTPEEIKIVEESSHR